LLEPPLELVQIEPVGVEEHQNVAGDRACADVSDPIVVTQALPELQRERRLAAEHRDVHPRPAGYRGGDDGEAPAAPALTFTNAARGHAICADRCPSVEGAGPCRAVG
jgi:hypothetical protein